MGEWTNKKPTSEGYYWFKESYATDPRVLKVGERQGRLQAEEAGRAVEEWRKIDLYDGYWAGPIVQPRQDPTTSCDDKWSGESPTTAGWYWYKEDCPPHIIEVVDNYGYLEVDQTTTGAYPGQWSGPLTPPE